MQCDYKDVLLALGTLILNPSCLLDASFVSEVTRFGKLVLV